MSLEKLLELMLAAWMVAFLLATIVVIGHDIYLRW